MKTKKVKVIAKELLPPIMLKAFESVRPAKNQSNGGHEQLSDYYDEAFSNQERWHKHYTESNYYPLWSVLVDRIIHAKVESLLEIGCGPGQLSLFLHDQGLRRYLGFDFSARAVELARISCPELKYVEADAFKTDLFHSYDYDAVLCTEFLEHVDHDLEVIGKIRSGTRFYGTVPNFTCASHVRYFTSAQEVNDRYAEFFHSFSVNAYLSNSYTKRGEVFYLMEGIRV